MEEWQQAVAQVLNEAGYLFSCSHLDEHEEEGQFKEVDGEEEEDQQPEEEVGEAVIEDER
eukprot:2929683-Amphidinium_carterae.2